MSTYDLSSLAPSDASAALRSFPRRYREALRPLAEDESVEELARQHGDDGRSALGLATDTLRTWTVQAEALRKITIGDDPVVHQGVVDEEQRHWESSTEESLEDVLTQIDDTAVAFADQVDAIKGRDWKRTATTAGGGPVTALNVVRAAVRTGRDNLATAERILASVRRR